jgi:PAS domain S-box-containing protein
MRSKGTNRVALAASFLALGLFTLVWWKTNLWYRQELFTGQRAHVTAELAPYGNVLSGAINGKFGILNGLKAFVETHLSEPSFAPEFERFAAGLYAATTGLRVITVAPGAIPRYVYPLSGNESIIGHDPTRDPRPDVRADVERAIHSREITLSGPEQLRPGGLGLIARLSVYRDRTFWGFVTIAFDLENLLRESGLNPGPAALRFALRSRSGQVFFGDRAVFDGEPVIHRVELAGGFWELAAIPRSEWNASIREPLAVFNGAAVIIIASLTLLAYLGVNREARLMVEVKNRTAEIYQAKEELEIDIAERKRIEEELNKAHNELEQRVRQRTADLGKANEALAAEIDERKKTEQERDLLLAITQAVSEAEDFHSALGVALRKICEATSWAIGEAWVPSPDGTALELSPAWYGIGEAVERFRKMTTASRPQSGAGLIVRVWHSKQPEWIPDVSVTPLFNRAEVARQAGLKAGLAVPTIADEHVQAVLVFFMYVSREEDKRLIEIVSAVAAQLGSLIQRKRAEQALRESERRFQAIFHQTFQFVGLLNPDGILLEVNQTALEFIGRNLADVAGRPFWETPWWDVSPDVRNRVKDAIAEAAKGNFVRYETEHRRSDGSIATFDFSLKPVFDDDGVVVLIIPEGRDISNRKRAEEELRKARDELEIRVQERTQELARTNEELRTEIAERQRLQEQLIENSRLAAIGTTAAKIAHEIANPLNGMSLTVQRLERQLASHTSGLDQPIQTTLRRLRDEIRRLTGLLDDFRSLSRREQYNFQPTALAVIAAEILAMEVESCVAKGIRVEQLLPPDLPLVQADRNKLKQALWNLCKNAVEAMPQGGTLTLRARSSGADVILEIADTGAGVPAGVDIFEPFTTTKLSGSGLGLVVVRQVVAAHGGSITYSSEPGKGSKFRLSLPQAARQREHTAPEHR